MSTPAKKPASQTTGRKRRVHPMGSVLIIVIVLLLLLAIMGTAYLSTTQGDKLTSSQNLLSAQADAQVEGIANSVGAKIVDDLNDTTTPPTGPLLRGPLSVNYQGAWNAAVTYNPG